MQRVCRLSLSLRIKFCTTWVHRSFLIFLVKQLWDSRSYEYDNSVVQFTAAHYMAVLMYVNSLNYPRHSCWVHQLENIDYRNLSWNTSYASTNFWRRILLSQLFCTIKYLLDIRNWQGLLPKYTKDIANAIMHISHEYECKNYSKILVLRILQLEL